MRKQLLLAAICGILAPAIRAELLQDALSAFPAQTYSLEFDALNILRQLPNYRNLRQQYSGEGLQQAQRDLQLLGISEDQLDEVVTAAGPNGFFGMLAGSFASATAAKQAALHGMAQNAFEDGPVFCPKAGYCFFFPAAEEGHVFFATSTQLRLIAEVRAGRVASLRSNTTFMELFNRREPRAPVFGVAPGREIGTWVGETIPPAISSKVNLNSLFSGIETFGYSVKVDGKAHLSLNLACTSEQSSLLLQNALSAASGLQRAAAFAGGSSALPFDNMLVHASGRMVAVNLDAPIP